MGGATPGMVNYGGLSSQQTPQGYGSMSSPQGYNAWMQNFLQSLYLPQQQQWQNANALMGGYGQGAGDLVGSYNPYAAIPAGATRQAPAPNVAPVSAPVVEDPSTMVDPNAVAMLSASESGAGNKRGGRVGLGTGETKNNPKMDFYNPSTYTPPAMPPRPIEADYPKGTPLNDQGNLSKTIEGRPLTAQVVAGRSAVGNDGIYPDRGIDPQTLKRIGTEAGSASFLETTPRSLGKSVGILKNIRNPVTGKRENIISVRNDLSPEGGNNVRAHEIAHLFDFMVGKLPVPSKGPVRDEMHQVYHHLTTGASPKPGGEAKYNLQTPEAFGYSGEKADRELAAESIRAYMANPNYLKSIAPKTAFLIRKTFNNHPHLSKFIQFNSALFALLGASGMYSSGGMVGQDPQKAIRRATMVAKSIARDVGPIPSQPAAPAVHPASMVPGVHVASEPQHFAEGGDVQPTDETGFDAWHGTPHEFPAERLIQHPTGEQEHIPASQPVPEGASVIKEFPLGRFRSDKIGTGEGAQAYGHGLYLGEEPTAKSYRDRLAAYDPNKIRLNGQDYSLIGQEKRKFIRELKKMGASSIEAITALETLQRHKNNLDAASGELRWSDDDEKAKIADFLDKMEHPPIPGHIYHVRVNANPEHFLDWDKPLSEQSEHVQKALEALHGEKMGYNSQILHPSNKGDNLYYTLALRFGRTREAHAQPTAAALHAAGIPGIRYLDANSRGPTGNPTHNHVIFDPSIIDIKRRYKRGGAVERHGYATDGGVPSGDDPTVQKALGVVRKVTPQGLYSQGAEAAAALPQAKGSPQQMLAMLTARGVKPEEMQWSGAQDAFQNQKSITRDQLMQQFNQGLPKIHETVLSEQTGQPTKYEHHQIPGSHNVDENKINDWLEDYAKKYAVESGDIDHEREWNDAEQHVKDWHRDLAKNEFNNRDFHDPSFKEQFISNEPAKNNYRELILHIPSIANKTNYGHWDQPNVLGHIRMSDRNDGKTLHLEELQSDWGQQARKLGVQPAPYVNTTHGWTDLLLKRALHEAATGGYDRMTWTPGEMQAKRWDNKGLIPYYDQIVPKRLQDVVKRIGHKAVLEPHTIDTRDPQKMLPSIRITPELRETILKGMPAYEHGGTVDQALALTRRYARG